MSEIEYTAILNAIDTIKEANGKAHDDIRELIHEGLKGVHLNIAAAADATNVKVDTLVERQGKMNGNVARLQEDVLKGYKMAADFRKMESDILNYKKKWLYFAVGAMVFVIAIVVIYDMIGLRGIIELVK